MAARSVVSLGVSVDRDAVHGVALTEGRDRLPDRVCDRRTEEIGGERGDLTVAIESVLGGLAGAVGGECEISGVAVTYRDAAERRAVVTGLAAGPWHDASLVSVRSAHLALAAASTWMSEFDHVVVCEVGPGLQAFSLIGPDRDRVVAGVTTTAAVVNDETIGLAVAAAWEQFEAAEVRPDAVAVVGSAAPKAPIVAALESGFAAPAIPCMLAETGPAVGAALVALPEVEAEDEDGARGSRRGVMLLAAAGVLAGGLAVTSAYELGAGATSSAPVRVDAHGTADDHKLPTAPTAAAVAPAHPSVVAGQSDLSVPEYVPVPIAPSDISETDSSTSDSSSWDYSDSTQSSSDDYTPVVSPKLQQTDSGPSATLGDAQVVPGDAQVVPVDAQAVPGDAQTAPGDPQTATDDSPSNSATGHPVSPNADLRGSNRTSNSPAAAADFSAWWENHWPQMVQWAITPHP